MPTISGDIGMFHFELLVGLPKLYPLAIWEILRISSIGLENWAQKKKNMYSWSSLTQDLSWWFWAIFLKHLWYIHHLSTTASLATNAGSWRKILDISMLEPCVPFTSKTRSPSWRKTKTRCSSPWHQWRSTTWRSEDTLWQTNIAT